MVRIDDAVKILEEFAPLELSEDFDNCGYKTGSGKLELSGILVTVDTNRDVVKEAVGKGCNLIIEHHPSIWKPLKSIDPSRPLNTVLIEAIKSDVCIYSAHTNVDYTNGGLNDTVAYAMGLKNVSYIKTPSSARQGETDKNYTLKEYARKISELFSDDNVSIVGDPEKIIKKVAVINGGGGREDALLETMEAGNDVFVTAEVKHSVARLAKDSDYAIIQVGHYSSEKLFMNLIKDLYSKKLPQIQVYCAESIGDPYNKRGEIWT